MKRSNAILKLVFESITIEITKRKNNNNGAPLAQNIIVICMALLLQKWPQKYIDKYMLLNVDCSSQNDSRRRNISLFDNRAFLNPDEINKKYLNYSISIKPLNTYNTIK